MLDEETGAEPRAISASIADPFLLIIRDDSSAFVAQMDSSNELEELEKEDQTLATTKWLTGCLYADTTGAFAEEVAAKGGKPAQTILMFLLSANGSLYVSTLGMVALVTLVTWWVLTKLRYTGFRTCRNQSMSPKDCLTYPQASRPIILHGKAQQRRRWQRFWWLISVTQLTNPRILLFVVPSLSSLRELTSGSFVMPTTTSQSTSRSATIRVLVRISPRPCSSRSSQTRPLPKARKKRTRMRQRTSRGYYPCAGAAISPDTAPFFFPVHRRVLSSSHPNQRRVCCHSKGQA